MNQNDREFWGNVFTGILAVFIGCICMVIVIGFATVAFSKDDTKRVDLGPKKVQEVRNAVASCNRISLERENYVWNVYGKNCTNGR